MLELHTEKVPILKYLRESVSLFNVQARDCGITLKVRSRCWSAHCPIPPTSSPFILPHPPSFPHSLIHSFPYNLVPLYPYTLSNRSLVTHQGMGKTVITLSLILANPAPLKNDDLTVAQANDHWGAFSPGQAGDTAAGQVCRLSLVACHLLFVTGRLSLVICYLSLVACCV